MAIKIHDYFKNYKHKTLTYFLLLQIISGLLAGICVFLAAQFLSNAPINIFVLALVVNVVCNIIFGIILFSVASKPHKILSQAVAHVSKDPVVTEPPRVDTKEAETSGLRQVVQTVYELAAQTQQNASGAVVSSQTAAAAFFKELADDLPCGLIALSKDGSIVYSNHLAPIKDLPDGHIEPMLFFEQRDTLGQWLTKSESNKVRDLRTWQRIASKLPGEKDRHIYDVIAFYQKENPAGIAAIVLTVDRTEVYSVDQEDMDFIALAAHELRGPITVIRGYLDVIKNDLKGKFSPDEEELFDRLQVSSERLAGYINNILNVSRYDRNQFQLHIHEESLMDIIKSLVPDLALRARTQHRKLIFRIPKDLPTIATDSTSLGEVITNLIDNAIKYSHENGQIIITATAKDSSMVEITVQDFGVGMPESIIGELFTRFYRSHRSRQNVGGTGLGLYICKAMVELHGGSIWVRSKEGEGSTFGFTVPIYSTVASKLQAGDNQNNDIVQRPEGWIKNHAMYRR